MYVFCISEFIALIIKLSTRQNSPRNYFNVIFILVNAHVLITTSLKKTTDTKIALKIINDLPAEKFSLFPKFEKKLSLI